MYISYSYILLTIKNCKYYNIYFSLLNIINKYEYYYN